jgi:hypothetical protein
MLKTLKNQYIDSLKILRDSNKVILLPVSLDGILSDTLTQTIGELYPNIRKSYITAIMKKQLEGGKLIVIKKTNPMFIIMPISFRFTSSIKNEFIKLGVEKINSILTENNIDTISIDVSKWEQEHINLLKATKKYKIKIYNYNEKILEEKDNE